MIISHFRLNDDFKLKPRKKAICNRLFLLLSYIFSTEIRKFDALPCTEM